MMTMKRTTLVALGDRLQVYNMHHTVQFSSVQARDRPSGLRAFAEVLRERSGRDVSLGTAGTPEAAKITSLSDE